MPSAIDVTRHQAAAIDGQSSRSATSTSARAGVVPSVSAASLELLAARVESDLLTIASVPTFTTKWLIPRLPGFLGGTPGVTISFCRHLAQGDPFPLDLDAAIRYGDGGWEGVVSEYIDGRTFVVVCGSEFPDRHRLREPQDVAHAPRLLIQAAQAGLGLALIPAMLVRDNLAAGTLVEPLAAPLEMEHGHYLCYFPDRMEERPRLRQFRDWLLSQASGR